MNHTEAWTTKLTGLDGKTGYQIKIVNPNGYFIVEIDALTKDIKIIKDRTSEQEL